MLSNWNIALLFCLVVVPATLFAQQPAGKPLDDKIAGHEKVLIVFDGPIGPMLRQFVFRKLDEAKRLGADTVIVEINSPGGLVDESFSIAERLSGTDWARTVAFIPSQAISGAAFVALGCDEIIMAPDAALGDAGPITLDTNMQFQHVPEKIRSLLAERVRTLAEAKGRSPALAEAMVDMDLSVYRVKNLTTGKEAFMTDEEIKASDDPKEWEKVKPVFESRKKHFLNVNGARAVELGLAQGTASSREELCERLGFKESRLVVLAPTFFDRFAYFLNYPAVTGILFVIGLVGIYIEFSSPGIGVGGLTAALCFGIFFWSHFLGGTVTWLEIVLFVAGVAFVFVEIFVIPGFGVAGISGVILILFSLVMACQTTLIPKTAGQWNSLAVTLQTIFIAGIVFIIIAFFINSRLRVIPVLNRIMLPPPGPDGRVDAERPANGQTGTEADLSQEGLGIAIGDRGVALSLLRPAGKAEFDNRRIDVVTDGDFINKGDRVEVVEISGNRVVVIPTPK